MMDCETAAEARVTAVALGAVTAEDIKYPYSYPQTDPPPIDHVRPHAILARRNVPELEELVVLRRQGWDDERLDTHFKDLREVSDHANENIQHIWFAKMRSIAKELDTAGQVVPTASFFEFLDVGCAPGGFNSYVLRMNPQARGVGITLPESAGGHAFLLERHYLPRYELIEQELLQYTHSPTHLLPSSQQAECKPFPKQLCSRFPLVLLDGHALRTYHHPQPLTTPEEFKHAHGVYRDRLLVTQLIIALEAVSPGGPIVTRLSHIECFPAAHMLYMLDQLAGGGLIVHKPKSMHASRGTCYVIAKGICSPGRESEVLRVRYVEGLKGLWGELGSGGSYGHGRMMVPGDLDFVVTAEELLDGYLDRNGGKHQSPTPLLSKH
ncbi:hypothetical protein C8Q80DRAFT_1347080 [Daedaleopsis nitida]|nr:hypothetical protein C8Q80DRAFT_1347080 [Daedaleopsis nitida]